MELESPSLRRVWVEMSICALISAAPVSPSLRRVWVEISADNSAKQRGSCHPPCGGCGLKSIITNINTIARTSPSLRRVWVEITTLQGLYLIKSSPSLRRVWVEMAEDEDYRFCAWVTLLAEGVG